MHVVLLGDSIFDNAAYVPGGAPLIEQLRGLLPRGWQATLIAVDGHIVEDVYQQLDQLPPDATHLVISCGGNDALLRRYVLEQPVSTIGEAMHRFAGIMDEFAESYHEMLGKAMATGLPVFVCTIYDAIPGLEAASKSTLSLYNDCILRQAMAAKAGILDLRLRCNEVEDFSEISPIEPSVLGGAKIAAYICGMVAGNAWLP